MLEASAILILIKQSGLQRNPLNENNDGQLRNYQHWTSEALEVVECKTE